MNATERRANAQERDRIAAHYHASAAHATNCLAGLRLALNDARRSAHNRREALAAMIEDAENHVMAEGMPLADLDDYHAIHVAMGTLAGIDRQLAACLKALES